MRPRWELDSLAFTLPETPEYVDGVGAPKPLWDKRSARFDASFSFRRRRLPLREIRAVSVGAREGPVLHSNR
jgi:hypothetical protein